MDRRRIDATPRAWAPTMAEVKFLPFNMPRGLPHRLMQLAGRPPWLSRYPYGAPRIRFGDAAA